MGTPQQWVHPNSGYTPTQVTLDQGQPLSLTPLSDRREDLVTQQGVHLNSGYTPTVGTPQQWVHPNSGYTPTQVTLDQGQPLSLTPLSDRREDLVTQQGVHLNSGYTQQGVHPNSGYTQQRVHPNSGYTSTVGTPQQWVHPNSGYTPTQVTLDQGQPLSLTPLSDRREDLVTQQGVHLNSGYTPTVGTPQRRSHSIRVSRCLSHHSLTAGKTW